MSRRSGVTYRIGTGALSLLMILVVLCLTALSVLSWSSAGTDHKLALRAGEVTAAVTAAQSEAQRMLSKVDGLLAACRADTAEDAAYLSAAVKALEARLPEVAVEDRQVSFDVPATEQLTLHAALTILPREDAARYALTAFVIQAAPTGFELMD